MNLFIDTWGWVTLRDKHEHKHGEASQFYVDFRAQGGRVHTTDYVLDETFTLMFKRLPFSQAEESMRLLERAIANEFLNLEWITPERFDEAKALRFKYQDKPNFSFTDLTSIVVMDELSIRQILTEDEHFTHVGMGFQLVP